MTEQPTIVDVIPLQEKPQLSNLGPYFRGVDRGFKKLRVDPVNPVEQLLDGRPYAAAPSVAAEVRHLLGLQSVVHGLIGQGQQITPVEIREILLRTAALCDRLALMVADEDDADATAVQAAWELQVHDALHRRLVLGAWQADAIHWAPLTDDPGSGDRLYVRQEYPLWLQSFEPGWRSFFGRPVKRV